MNKERLNKLLKDIDNALYDLKINQCNVDVTTKGHKWETYYGLDDDLIKYIRKIENSNKILQSKIDKANEILDKLEMQPAYLDCKYYELGGFDELRNALKEDK